MTILVHDYLLVNRGAERTFTAICELFPESPVSTLLYDSEVFEKLLRGHPLHTSPLQALGLDQRNFKAALPLLPLAAQRLPVQGHNLVVSSSSAFAHAVRADRDATHVCYCHTPFRYAWYETQRALSETPRALRPAMNLLLRRLRRWDYKVAQRGTHYVANGEITQKRIRAFWGLDVPVVYPPVDTARFTPAEPDDFLLFVGELVKHKRVELALQAAAIANVPIKIVGGGTESARLRQQYGHRAGVTFMGRLPDDDLTELYPRARALVIPGVEEFGITAVEAQAAGRPVIAADGGGARETIIPNATGILFTPDDATSLAAAMNHPLLREDTASEARSNAARFSIAAFHDNFSREVASARSS